MLNLNNWRFDSVRFDWNVNILLLSTASLRLRHGLSPCICLGLGYLFNGISTPCGMFNAKSWFIITITINIFNVPLQSFFFFELYFLSIIIIYLPAVKWYQVFLFNTNNLHNYMISRISVQHYILKRIYLTHRWVWFGLVLCHINHCRLFNAKFYLYIYIKYTWF